MKSITLQQVVTACNGTYFGDKAMLSTVITDITTDSRKIAENSLFIPIKGERFDAHNFIEDTFEKGAVCALSEKKLDTKGNYILVNSTFQSLKDIAKFYRGLFKIPVIGISGSVGKTSTKEMIASVLQQKYKVMKTIGNFNNEIGVPLTLFSLEDSHEVAVVEMGISDFDEMNRLSEMVQPDICVITNIGTCHLEKLIDRNGVLKAKTEMFNHMNKNGKIFLNGDDDKLSTIKEAYGVIPSFYGLNNTNEYYGEVIENSGITGIKSVLHYSKGEIAVTIPAIGNYMVANAMVAVAIGKALKLTDEQIKDGIQSYKTVGSRDNLISTGYISIIDDCYNANPVSVKGAIDTLCNLKGSHVCILGDMKELGTDEHELHYGVGKYAADKGVDTLIAIGELAENIAKGATESGVETVHYFLETQPAINQLKDIINKDDIVLVKGSRAMHLETVVAALEKLQ